MGPVSCSISQSSCASLASVPRKASGDEPCEAMSRLRRMAKQIRTISSTLTRCRPDVDIRIWQRWQTDAVEDVADGIYMRNLRRRRVQHPNSFEGIRSVHAHTQVFRWMTE